MCWLMMPKSSNTASAKIEPGFDMVIKRVADKQGLNLGMHETSGLG